MKVRLRIREAVVQDTDEYNFHDISELKRRVIDYIRDKRRVHCPVGFENGDLTLEEISYEDEDILREYYLGRRYTGDIDREYASGGMSLSYDLLVARTVMILYGMPMSMAVEDKAISNALEKSIDYMNRTYHQLDL